MAEPVALGIKPPTPMSLGDMLNIARGAQAYQQEQQMNPVALQKAQQETRLGQINLGVEEQKNKERLNLQTFMSDPANWQTNGKVDLNKLNSQVSQIAPLTGREQIGKLTELATAQIGTGKQQLDLDQSHFSLSANILAGLETRAQALAKKGDSATALKELKAAEAWMNASGIPSKEGGPTRQAEEQLKNKDFTGYLATLENMRNVLGGAASRYQANLPQLSTVAGAPAAFTPANATANPLQIGGQTPPPSNQQNVVPPQGGAQTQNFPQSGVTPTQMSLPYPVRRAGDIRPYAPSEKYDEEKGQAYRDTLANEARNLTTYRRSTDEVIREAEKIGKEEWNQGAGFFGKMGRNFSTFLGTEQGVAYKNLSKALANVQMNSMKALGLSTDADKTLSAAANGDYTYPPEVLTKIAGQAHGNMTNIELQTKGAQAFGKKYGDSNQQVFQDLWNSNSKDTRVFEAIAINDSNIPKEQKIKKIDKLLEDMSPAEIDALTKSKNRLLKLSKTGEL